ncbi:hypothetical protein EV421DRAFT_1716489 [Armillaria borealis]|uniref:DUF6589 domain-containing protein n=1 Tax=Armillaria borealis TaxID=47425 RepID=A0AA39MJ50_9AGAR|nr:hypothetical protein EV421DRAFT_1716489 [Armillaria borealis]
MSATTVHVSPVRSQSLPPESSPIRRPIEDLPVESAAKVAGKRGRPKGSKSKVSRRGQTREERVAATEAERLRRKEEQRLLNETRTAFKKTKKDLEDTLRKLEDTDNAWKAVKENICTPQDRGGAGFKNIGHFMASLMGPTLDTQTAANRTRWARDYGLDYMHSIARLAPQAEEEFFSDVLRRTFEREGQAIQKMMTRQWTTKILDLLQSFSMDELANEFQAAAPTIWDALTSASTTAAYENEQVQRDKSLVLTCICAMISILRSQKANNFQLTMGLFLFGSGAAKREIAVLAHAGLCVSYTSILDHIKKMSNEGMKEQMGVIQECMCSIVWDNLNIPFRVGEQRFGSKDHFDNGTTATLLVLFGGTEERQRLPLGTIPVSMKPERKTTDPLFDWDITHTVPDRQTLDELTACTLWQVMRLAIEHVPELQHLLETLEACPTVRQILVHITEHYPMPAMHIDESSIEGTIRVYITILTQYLKLSDEDLVKHGLLFTHGDLLTDSLMDKIEAARRNCEEIIEGIKASTRVWGLFHAKMAGCRLVTNEHWGKPNGNLPGGLWWESNTLLGRKPMSAGWKGNKATPWRPSHELLHISLPAHIIDGFRIHCGQASMSEWAKNATLDEVRQVARLVVDKLFSTKELERLRGEPDDSRDFTLENTILYNRDALFYIEFVHAVKHGDIGRVRNVLNVWMVMMRGVATMPRYADAIFELIGRLKTYDPILRDTILDNWLVNLTGRSDGFKEVDLLQEHQNFWAKVIYNAKGTNRSWKWLSMITVCIWTLRDAMRTVHKAFSIPGYGTKHTNPDIALEVKAISDALQAQNIQSYVPRRAGNEHISPVRDLIRNGVQYPNEKKAFHKFRADPRRVQNIGIVDPPDDSGDEDDGEQQEETEGSSDFMNDGPTMEDLAMDNEEDYNAITTVFTQADMLTGDAM